MESEPYASRRFAGLLFAQVLFIFLTPFVGDSTEGTVFLHVGVFGILAAGLYAASTERSLFRISLVILLPVLYAWVGPDLIGDTPDRALRMLTPAICYAFTAYVVGRELFRQKRITHDTVLGGINIYLLLSFSFVFLHMGIMVLAPGSYLIFGEPLAAWSESVADSTSFPTLLYFSYTTLTTLGYGDIVPVGAVARLVSGAEAMIGQLYVAIFIGRLVSLAVATQREESGESSA